MLRKCPFTPLKIQNKYFTQMLSVGGMIPVRSWLMATSKGAIATLPTPVRVTSNNIPLGIT